MFTAAVLAYASSMNPRSNLNPPDHTGNQQAGAPAFLWWLVGAMALIEFALNAADVGIIGTPEWRVLAFKYGAFWQPLLSDDISALFKGQRVTMFVTHAFLHGGITHLLLNSVVLLALGKTISERAGAQKTLLVLLVSAIGGAAAFGLISSSNWPMIGASGAVFGLLGVWQTWDYCMRRRMHQPVQPVLGAITGLIIANVLIDVLLSGGLAWEAHLGGWLMGCFAATTFVRIQ